MYPNLRAEMARKGISTVELAERAGIATTTMYDKINGKTKITLDDAHAIKKALDVNMSIEELFAKEVA